MPALAEDATPIGLVATLTGGGAYRGQDMLGGFMLGLKSAGGRLGGVEVEIVTADDGAAPVPAGAAVRKLLAESNPPVVLAGARTPEIMAAIASPAIAAGAIVIALGDAPRSFAGSACDPSFFSVAGLADGSHAAMAAYLHDAGYRRLAIFAPDTNDGGAAVAAFRRLYRGEVAEIVSKRGQMDFSQDLLPLRRLEVDAVYSVHTGGMQVNLLRQYAAAGLKQVGSVAGPAASLPAVTVAAADEAAAGAISAANWAEDLENPINQRFVAEFEAEYRRVPSYDAAMGYDAALWLDAALRSTGDRPARDDLRQALRGTRFSSTRGQFRLGENHFPIQNWYLRQVATTPKGRLGSVTRGVVFSERAEPQARECGMKWHEAAPPPSPRKK